MAKRESYKLLNNSRFYILVFSFLFSLAVVSYLRINIASDQLFLIRVQQVFGAACLIYWYVALTISPLGYIIGKDRLKHIEFARRAIGVSAFYFATLHATVAFWGQLGGFAKLDLLPESFKWSIAGGLVGLFILFLMASTSLDKIIDFMTYRKWKWLHRLGYIGGTLVIIHVWTIGTHLSYPVLQWGSFTALAVLAGLELNRVTKNLNKKYLNLSPQEICGLFLGLWLLTLIALLMIPLVFKNYHSKHAHQATSTQDTR